MNGGYVIRDHRCPRCGNNRTVQLARSGRNFCFNCRWLWSATVEVALSYPFTAEELARLATYRAAVRAGFYNEWTSGALDPAL